MISTNAEVAKERQEARERNSLPRQALQAFSVIVEEVFVAKMPCNYRNKGILIMP
jgi:hypothetical protein